MPHGQHASTTYANELCDPELYQQGNPEDLWRRMHSAALVHEGTYEGRRFHAVLSHPLISQVLKNTREYSSERGMRLDQNPAATSAAAGKMLIITDPPRHGRIRRIVNSVFTPRMVSRLEQNMRATAAAAVDRAIEEGECDFTTVAARLPLSVICDMLGVPPEDWDFMLDRTMVAFGSDQADEFAMAEAHADILSYYEDLVRRRRREPGEDVVTALVNGVIDGTGLTDEEIYLNCDGLISGGNETTRHATIGGLLALIQNPGQWAMLRDDPGLLPGAVQEVLRFTSPAMHVLRTAVVATEIGEYALRPGDPVALWLAAGNRDPEVFADPDRFDITRHPNPHVAFAAGPHYCLGSALATSELTVVFEELLRRVSGAELTGLPRRTRSILIRGYDSVPVRLAAA
ncbi:cytochrome P450 [Streptomyces sp. CHD11]|uniref:cytochrome P450 n=1 Tax=Streptomyces sp. CHD11 TaxID=2741325 RepID=UPI001BFC5EDE|nr:cytochrome P450 [Streptomyces sp. CHD11]MBT3153130.1 cytochrome P450 [Streptomyces sp. CHD11]